MSNDEKILSLLMAMQGQINSLQENVAEMREELYVVKGILKMKNHMRIEEIEKITYNKNYLVGEQ
jgi:hypothetical protein